MSEIIDLLLLVALVFTWQSGKAPSLAMILLCIVTWRTLPSPYAEAVTGLMLLVGGVATRRRIARRGDP